MKSTNSRPGNTKALHVGVLMMLLLSPAPATVGQVKREAMGVARFRIEGPNGLFTKHVPMRENEALDLELRNDVVSGYETLQLEEQDVLIEVDGTPLALLKQLSRNELAIAHASCLQDLSRVAAEIARVENQVRAGHRMPAIRTDHVIGHAYVHVFYGLAARLHKDSVKAIKQLPWVKRVAPDRQMHAMLAESVPLIRANRVWTELGLTGRGVTVAVVDTGIDYTHPDLGGCLGPGCKILSGYDFVNKDTDPMDDNGHGTHVAGIVAANGAVRGVAPNATLLAFKVLDKSGDGSASDVIAGIERAVDPDGNPATKDSAHVINLSLGADSGDPDDPVSEAVDNAVAAGVVVVAAAGNRGEYEGVTSPGTARQALTVGASDKSNQIATFSSRGPALKSFQIKPEVIAPGVNIVSTVPTGSCELCHASGYRPLSGTSQAAPHVTGAAALLLERFPTWAPQQVKDALMGRAVSLGRDAFTQGSGRIDAYASVTSPVLASPGNLSLGLDDITQPAFDQTKTLALTNLTTSPVSCAVSVEASLPTGATTTVMPASLDLAPGETKRFTFQLTVNNMSVPNPPNAPYAYEGSVILKGGGRETLQLPFAFVKSPVLEVAFDEEPWILDIHNRVNLSRRLSYLGMSRTMPVPEGLYDLIVLFQDATTRVLREGVAVRTKTQVTIAKTEAVHPLTIFPVDKDGNLLTLTRSMVDCLFIHKTSGFGSITIHPWPATSFRFSSMSDAYLFEASLIENPGPLGRPAYTFHADVRGGITGPIEFRNSPADFKRVVTRHTVDPGVTQVVPQLWSGTLWVEGSPQCRNTDPPLTAPFEEEAYYMPASYPEFALGYVRKEVFRNPASPCQFQPSEFMFETPRLRPKDRNEIEGYFLDWEAPGRKVKVFSTASERLPSGIGPYSWFGRFTNSPTKIWLRSALGSKVNLFLGQARDLRPHNGLPYELYQGRTLIKSGSLAGVGISCAAVPVCFWPQSVSIPVRLSGPYRLKIPFSDFYVGGQPGQAIVIASFNTAIPHPNPPYLTAFNLLTNGDLTDSIPSLGGEVQLKVFDDVALGSISLFYDAGSGWQTLRLVNVAPDEYCAIIPPWGTDVSFVALRLVVKDTSGNSLTLELTPAFRRTSVPLATQAGSKGRTQGRGILQPWQDLPKAR